MLMVSNLNDNNPLQYDTIDFQCYFFRKLITFQGIEAHEYVRDTMH